MKITKNIFFLFLTLILCSCIHTQKQEVLWESFCNYNMRNIPIRFARFEKLNEFDITYQNLHSFNDNYNYRNTYVLGLYNNDSNKYVRIHCIDGFSPKENYSLIKAVSDFYTTDTTYLSDIILTNKLTPLLNDTMDCYNKNEIPSTIKKYVAWVYRKTDIKKQKKYYFEYMVWKRIIVSFENGRLKTELIEELNKDEF